MLLAHLLATWLLWTVGARGPVTPAQTAPLACSHHPATPANGPRWTFYWAGMDLGVGEGPAPLEVITSVDRTVELSFPDLDGLRMTCRRVVNEETIRDFRAAIAASKVCAFSSVNYGPTKRRIDLSVEFDPDLHCSHAYEWTKWQRSAAGQKVKAALEWLTRATCASQCPPRGSDLREMLWPGP